MLKEAPVSTRAMDRCLSFEDAKPRLSVDMSQISISLARQLDSRKLVENSTDTH